MRRQTIGLTFLILVLVLPAAVARPDAMEDENLYGTWLVSSVEFNLKKDRPPMDMEAVMIFSKGGKTLIKRTGLPDLVGTWKVTGAKTIKKIDMVNPSSDGTGQETANGIYDIVGDTLRLAFAPEGQGGARPTAIDPKVARIVTLKRQKP